MQRRASISLVVGLRRPTLNQGGGFLSSVLQHLPSVSHCIPSQIGSSPYRLLLTHIVVGFPDSQKVVKSRHGYSITVHIAWALPAIGCSGGTISKSNSKCPNVGTRYSMSKTKTIVIKCINVGLWYKYKCTCASNLVGSPWLSHIPCCIDTKLYFSIHYHLNY